MESIYLKCKEILDDCISFNTFVIYETKYPQFVSYICIHVWIKIILFCIHHYYTPPNNKVVGGYIGFTPSVCPSVRPSVCPACRVRSVTSTVLDGFFPYQPQMFTTMRGCVAHNDIWPWPLSSRSFGLDVENRVRSVTSTVLDGFFLYLAQMIAIIRWCVVCYVFFRIWKFVRLDLEKKNLQFLMNSFHI